MALRRKEVHTVLDLGGAGYRRFKPPANLRTINIINVGREDGIDFLVMEYLGGWNLWDRLKRGLLPFKLALGYAAELATA